MKTIITLGVGFWLGRQLFINFDRQEALKKETAIKKRLVSFLKEKRFSSTELKQYSNKIIGN